ncbi:hypothetical protein Hanom_Chr02g00155681 [Helianthus anomalus]
MYYHGVFTITPLRHLFTHSFYHPEKGERERGGGVYCYRGRGGDIEEIHVRVQMFFRVSPYTADGCGSMMVVQHDDDGSGQQRWRPSRGWPCRCGWS